MYAMITNWEFSEITDEMINTVETVFFPRLKATGAMDVYNIKTSKTSDTVVSIWPDQATADKAVEAVMYALKLRLLLIQLLSQPKVDQWL